jgi:5'-nucleotidase
MVRAMNRVGYDAVALGNHEFDFGPLGPRSAAEAPGDDPRGALAARVKEAKFAWLSSNIAALSGRPPAPGIAPYALFSLRGVKVAVVGGTSEDLHRTTFISNVRDLSIRPLAQSVAHAAAHARKEGAAIVVALVHAGGECTGQPRRRDDKLPGDMVGCDERSEVFELARHLSRIAHAHPESRIEAIFGGHTHQALTAVVAGIPIVQPHLHGLELGHIALEVKAGHPTGHFVIDPPREICSLEVEGTCYPQTLERLARGTLHPPDFFGKVVPRPNVESSVAEYLERAAQLRIQKIGIQLPKGLPRGYRTESPLGNLVADTFRGAAKADIGMSNGGGLRADLPAGDLLYGALFEALPFDNRLAILNLDGASLRKLVRANLESTRGILSLSGVTVQAICRGSNLDVILTLENGKPVQDKQRYKIATSDFLALGGDDFGLFGLPNGSRPDLRGPPLREVVAEQLRRRGGELRADDPTIFDKTHPRISLPMKRPVRCP